MRGRASAPGDPFTPHTNAGEMPAFSLVRSSYFRPSLRGAKRRSNPDFLKGSGLLRGACHRARVRATRWLAMTECQRSGARRAADVDHIAVTGRGILVDKAG